MIALFALVLLGLVLLAWTRDGLTFRDFVLWLADRRQIEPGSTFTQDVARAQRERERVARALNRRHR